MRGCGQLQNALTNDPHRHVDVFAGVSPYFWGSVRPSIACVHKRHTHDVFFVTQSKHKKYIRSGVVIHPNVVTQMRTSLEETSMRGCARKTGEEICDDSAPFFSLLVVAELDDKQFRRQHEVSVAGNICSTFSVFNFLRDASMFAFWKANLCEMAISSVPTSL